MLIRGVRNIAMSVLAVLTIAASLHGQVRASAIAPDRVAIYPTSTSTHSTGDPQWSSGHRISAVPAESNPVLGGGSWLSYAGNMGAMVGAMSGLALLAVALVVAGARLGKKRRAAYRRAIMELAPASPERGWVHIRTSRREMAIGIAKS